VRNRTARRGPLAGDSDESGDPTQQLWLREVRLWQTRPEAWWEQQPALMALYPLCQHEKQPGDAIRHAAEVIERMLPAENPADLLALLGIFGKLAYPRLNVRKIFGEEKMKESKFIQEILEEENLRARRADIVRVLRARFRVEPPAEITASLATLDHVEQLETLLEQAATCERMEVFRTSLLALNPA
jgi:hypothetical protein